MHQRIAHYRWRFCRLPLEWSLSVFFSSGVGGLGQTHPRIFVCLLMQFGHVGKHSWGLESLIVLEVHECPCCCSCSLLLRAAFGATAVLQRYIAHLPRTHAYDPFKSYRNTARMIHTDVAVYTGLCVLDKCYIGPQVPRLGLPFVYDPLYAPTAD